MNEGVTALAVPNVGSTNNSKFPNLRSTHAHARPHPVAYLPFSLSISLFHFPFPFLFSFFPTIPLEIWAHSGGAAAQLRRQAPRGRPLRAAAAAGSPGDEPQG